MPIYVALGRATNEGARNLVGFRQRHAAAVKRAEAAGCKVLGSYALLGRYDYLVVLQAPDGETAAKVLIKEVARGNVRYETYTAIPIEEFATLVEEG
ncbi:MAG: GYD domain-containing protein [Chloroflexi bacterium]|nr:GYD domain-containing protein [Chloroflexota bacterium]